MNYGQLCNEDLLALLKEGDTSAFQTIYKLYWKECYRIAYSKLSSKVLAEEATQNIFTSLWERRKNLNIRNLEAYLHSATKYQVINLIEVQVLSKNRLQKLPKKEESFNPIEDTIYHDELMNALEIAIQQLPPKTSQIYLLSRYEYLSGREIAQKMGLSEKSVEYHISKALKFMRLELKDYAST